MRQFPCEFPGSGKALVYFGTQQCVPCKKVLPVLFELENIYKDVVFMACDITDGNYGSQACRELFEIRGVPTVIMFNFIDGVRHEIGRISGLVSKQKYIEFIEKE